MATKQHKTSLRFLHEFFNVAMDGVASLSLDYCPFKVLIIDELVIHPYHPMHINSK